MTFLKNNSKLIIKALLYQIVFSLFGNMMALGTLGTPSLFVVGSVIIIGLYMYMVFTMYNEAGLKIAVSKNKSNALVTAALTALIPAVPSLIMGAASCTGDLYYIDGSYTTQYALLQLQRLLFTGEYVGIFQSVFPPEVTKNAVGEIMESITNPSQPLAFFLAVLPQIIVSFTGMFLGLKEILLFKNQNKEK
ncbi:MAG: hypothetical protein E7665_05570 [Ruminococcaceae bacterium]|nr:hypothetical protein [Oscillospiraceae bacterium]